MPLTTDDEKRMLRERAEAMEANHVRRGDRDYGIDNTARSIHNRYAGLYGEWETAKQMGLDPAGVVDLSIRSGGDGRLGDFHVRIDCDNGPRRFWIDTKTNQYTGPNEMLRVPLRQMPTKEIAYQTIYVAVRYDKLTDDALPVGWEWGTVLIKENRVQTFGSRGVKNYVKPYDELRSLSDLTRRVLLPKVEETPEQEVAWCGDACQKCGHALNERRVCAYCYVRTPDLWKVPFQELTA